MPAISNFGLIKFCGKHIVLAAVLFLPFTAGAQSPFQNFANLFTTPKSYIVNYAKSTPVIDGDINDAAWQQAQWTDDFRDIEGDLKPNPPLKTNVKMLWDDSCLYIAAQIFDPHVWATLKQHDEIIFHDNDFEVFIDPNNTTHQYFEIEYNAFNTVFDLFLNKPYRNGGNPLINWDVKGLRSAVKIQGTLNDPSDIDKGWTVEMAIPFKSINMGIPTRAPVDGSVWRINFSRVEWGTKVVNGKYIKLKDSSGHYLAERNWVWSPQGVVNMHFPERWGYLQFNKDITNNKAFVLPYSEQQKRYLWLVYYQEKAWLKAHKTYQLSLKKLGLKSLVRIYDKSNTLRMEATKHQFMVLIGDKNGNTTWTINQDGLIQKLNTSSDE